VKNASNPSELAGGDRIDGLWRARTSVHQSLIAHGLRVGIVSARYGGMRADCQEQTLSHSKLALSSGRKSLRASGEDEVLLLLGRDLWAGLVLARAGGQPVAEYLEQKLWQPIGAEADATWLVDNSGQEVTSCCLNVLRDYARLGLLLAHDGNWRGRQIIPATWVLEATAVHMDQPHLWPGTATETEGYGYQTWIIPNERRMFMLWGAQGQRIYVDPRSKLVMVNTAVQEGFDPPALREMNALWYALVRQLGG
jgi:hypothetical protein